MKILPLVFLFVATATNAFQQPDSLQLDSLDRVVKSLNQQLETYERLMLQNDQKRKQDSLTRVELLKNIQLLKENDKFTEATLREKIKAIELRDSARNAALRNRVLELRANAVGFPVSPKDTLFTVFTKLGPISAEDRASNVTEKIEILVRDDYFYPDSLKAEDHHGTVDIMYNNLIVTSISEWDALWMETTSEALANTYLDKIRQSIIEKRARSSIKNLASRIGLVFLILGGAFLIIYFLNRLVDGLRGRLVQNRESYFRGFKIGTYEFMPPNRQLSTSLQIVNVLKWVMYALILYLSLPIIFTIFPFTRGWANMLIGWILQPARDILSSFWAYLPNFFTIAVILIITHYVVRFLKYVAKEIEIGSLKVNGFHSDWAMPTFRLVKFLVYTFVLVVVYPYLPGSDSEIFKGASIFVGLLISLGSTSAIGNAVAGLVITYMRPFKIGDRVTIGQTTGIIIEKTLLVTRLRTPKNEDVTVPNSAVLTGYTVNYSSNSNNLGLILHTSITIGYDVPWRQVHELLIEAAVATDGVNISREPFVLQKSLDDFYVSYELNAYTDMPDQLPRIYSDLHANIQDKFNQANVEIMSPHYRASRDGSQSTVPKVGD